MSPDLIPFRTYAVAAILSLLLNVGAIGTFATVEFVGSTSIGGANATTSAIAPLVLNELPPAPKPSDPEPTPDEPPKSEPEPPEASKPAPTPPAPHTPPPPPPPEDQSVKVGNPDAPDSKTSVWVGVSKDAGAIKGGRSTIDQAEFKPGLAGTPSEDAASNPSPQSASPAGPAESATQISKQHDPRQAVAQPSAAPENPAPQPDAKSDPQLEHKPDSQPTLDQPQQPSGQDSLGSNPPDPADQMNDAKPADTAAPAIPTTDDLFAATLDSAQDVTRLARRMMEAIAKASQAAPSEPATTANTAASEAPPKQNQSQHAAAPQPTPAPTSPSSTGQGGNGADRESDAFSKTTPVDVKLGQPLAGKGLFIKTVAPRWTTTTRVFYRPRNAFVRVKFGRDGRVIRASYVDGQDAGPPDVSGPLLDAVYRWTAKGQELSTIPPDQPQTGVVITFHIIWSD